VQKRHDRRKPFPLDWRATSGEKMAGSLDPTNIAASRTV
jgi:hypothetical protein